MLTSSPLAPRPSSAAARAFHYVPSSRSPQQSARVPAPLPRRQSKPSLSQQPSPGPAATAAAPLASPSPPSSSSSSSQPQPQPRPKQYVGKDASTQYSPMEPFDPAAPLQGVPAAAINNPRRLSSTAGAASSEPQTQSAAVAMAPAEPGLSPNGAAAHRHHHASTATPSPRSPTKRRKSSHDVPRVDSASSVVTLSQASPPKRPKPAPGPPKVLPLRYELCDVEDVVVLISSMIAELIETNDGLAMKSGHLTRFHSRTAPGISVLDYLQRLAKHATLTPPLLLSMVYYIDRLCALYPDFTINTLTVHRFLITAATVAGKGLSDSFWNNSFYAKVGGVKVAELKLLELEFLYRVDWKIVPNPEVLVAYYKGLIDRCPGFGLEGGGDSPSADDDSDDIDESDDSDH